MLLTVLAAALIAAMILGCPSVLTYAYVRPQKEGSLGSVSAELVQQAPLMPPTSLLAGMLQRSPVLKESAEQAGADWSLLSA